MTLTTILADLYRKLGFPTTPQTAVTTRLTAMVNETVQELLSEVGFSQPATLPAQITFASVASTPIYALSPLLSRVLAISEQTNNRRLERKEFDWYRTVEPNPTINTGTSSVWVPMGLTGIEAQPTAACELFCVSTAAETPTIYVEAVRTGGVPISLSTAMTGTTAKTLGASYTDIEMVTKCYLSAAATGTVTLRMDNGTGTVITTIPIGQTSARFEQIALWPTPASAITYYVDGERIVSDMANGTDEPPFPVRFHRMVVDGTLLKEWEKRDDSRYGQVKGRFERDKGRLKAYLWYSGDTIPVMGGGSGVRFSRLGGWAPAEWVK